TLEAMDGRFVAVSGASWDELADGIERLESPRPNDPARVREALAKMVAALTADDAVRRLRAVGLAARAVNSVADLVAERHLWARGDLMRRVDPELGEVVTQGIVPVLSLTPGRVGGWSRRPGSDNEAVLGTLLGYTPEQVRDATEAERAQG